jgi:hypothetical protein
VVAYRLDAVAVGIAQARRAVVGAAGRDAGVLDALNEKDVDGRA